MKALLAVLVSISVLSLGSAVRAQVLPLQSSTGRVKVEVTGESGPIEKANVRVGGQQAVTSAAGEATLMLPAGPAELAVERAGFLPQTIRATIVAGAEITVSVRLGPQPTVREDVTVSATRANVRVQDEPLRVEVLGREEVEEKVMMTPGDISMMLNETAGLRVQTTSPSLGAASLRVQGLRGRYTQLLADGLPLYGGQSGSIGLLQIPPMDLGQVEVIKGVASSLFGSSALGGVVNLVSRQPSTTPEHEVLLNQTTQGATDGMLWLAGPMNKQWGYTFLAGADHQLRHDVDGDGWADLPGFTRLSARPRIFWNDGAGRSMFLTVGLMGEDRVGGTMPGAVVPDGSPFQESLRTRREDAGLVAHVLVGKGVVGLRGSFMAQQYTRGFGSVSERDRSRTEFGELSLTSSWGHHTWVMGAALQTDAYRNQDVSRFDYTYWTPAVFGQDEFSPTESLHLSLSARIDHHNVFGTFVSPRGSVLWRLAGNWTVRASVGSGYFAPSPLTEKTEAVGLTRMAFADLTRAERARSYSADLGRHVGPIEFNLTAFGSQVDGTLDIRQAQPRSDQYELVPLAGPTRTRGAEVLAALHHQALSLIGTYTYVHATEPDVTTMRREEVPLTPAHTGGLVFTWEREGRARIGLEMYYTGRQRLTDDPYRIASEPYVYFGAIAERRFGRLRVFVNSENLSDRRQTRFDSLVRPTRLFDGRWTVDAWGPLEGRVLNAGVRLMF